MSKTIHCEECGAEFENGESTFEWVHDCYPKIVCACCFENMANDYFQDLDLQGKAKLLECEVSCADYGFHIGMGAYI